MKSFKIPNTAPNKKAMEKWLVDNDLIGDITYDWPGNILTFGNDEDASAFSLAFGLRRYQTTVEKMLENESD